MSSSQRPLPDNTRHSQQTNIHAPGGIWTQDLSRRAACGWGLQSPDCSNVLWYPNHSKSMMATTRILLSSQYILQRETFLTFTRSQDTRWSFFGFTQPSKGLFRHVREMYCLHVQSNWTEFRWVQKLMGVQIKNYREFWITFCNVFLHMAVLLYPPSEDTILLPNMRS